MHSVTGILASTRVNRRNERFTRECLEGAAAEANSAGGIPRLVNHDWTRVAGWTERLWVEPLGEDDYALRFDASTPETSEEERALRERFLRHIDAVQRREIEPYARALKDIGGASAAPLFASGCVGLVDVGLAHALCGSIAQPDDSGLVPIARLEPVAGGLFRKGDYLIAPHWMMRRYAYRLNSLNDVFIGTLKRLDAESELSCRVRLDDDFVGLTASLEMFGECDYWWGRRFTGDLLTQPAGVLCHGADDRVRVLEMLRRAELYLYRRDGETIVQVEEIHSGPLERQIAGEYYAVERYAHLVVNCRGEVVHLAGAVRLYAADSWRARQAPSVTIENAQSAEQRLKMFAVDGVTDQETAIEVVTAYFRGNPLVPELFGVPIDDVESDLPLGDPLSL